MSCPAFTANTINYHCLRTHRDLTSLWFNPRLRELTIHRAPANGAHPGRAEVKRSLPTAAVGRGLVWRRRHLLFI